MTPLHTKLVDEIARRDALDRPAVPVQRAIHGVLDRAPRVASALHGQAWLGHPLHAAVTDYPIGAFTAAIVLDAIGGPHPRRALRRAADLATQLGLASALLAAVPGLADWSGTDRDARRIGVVHGLLNVGVAGIYAASIVARARARRRTGIALSSIGFLGLLASSWLGGELAFAYGVGVQPPAPERSTAAERGASEPRPDLDVPPPPV